MKRIRVAGLCLVAVLAMSAVAVSNAAAALEFKSTVMGKLTGSAMNTQVFTTSAGKVECTSLKVTGGEAELNPESQKATIQYEGCTAFGFIGAKISPAEYLFNINGKVKVLKAIKIEAAGCVSTVPAQEVGSVSYVNQTVGGLGVVEIIANVTGITSSGTGTCKYAEEHKGTYKGTSLAGVTGGSLSA